VITGETLWISPQVSLYDSTGYNVVTDSDADVTIAVFPDMGLEGTQVGLSSGVATWSDLVIKGSGDSVYLVATMDETMAVSNRFAVHQSYTVAGLSANTIQDAHLTDAMTFYTYLVDSAGNLIDKSRVRV